MEWKPTPQLRFVRRTSDALGYSTILQQRWAGYDGCQGSTVQYEWRDVQLMEETDD